jgi:glyoxylase-like metal-dependent hydrolase (beta-lactamase superfamily II)
MDIHIIPTGYLKLDGGAMFGIVPKRLWNRLNPADDNNLCSWSMRCLLLETGDRKILIDTGMGDKQDAKFRSHFEPHGEETLLSSLQNKGFQPEDITDVFLTHLHFDHVGGAVSRDAEGRLVPTFPKARYWSNEVHWQWALHPNEREQASFLQENFVPLRDAGLVHMLPVTTEDYQWLPGIRIRYVYGHTEAMMILFIENGHGQTLVYCADLLPSSHHIGMPYVMAYDVRPLLTLDEKRALLNEAVENNYLLLFEHDPVVAAATVHRQENGRIVVKEAFETL